MVLRLNEEKATLGKNIDACQKEISLLEAKIAKGRNEEDDTPIDSAIYAPAPLYKQ